MFMIIMNVYNKAHASCSHHRKNSVSRHSFHLNYRILLAQIIVIHRTYVGGMRNFCNFHRMMLIHWLARGRLWDPRPQRCDHSTTIFSTGKNQNLQLIHHPLCIIYSWTTLQVFEADAREVGVPQKSFLGPFLFRFSICAPVRKLVGLNKFKIFMGRYLFLK
jgi:hypothetical protein